MLEVKRKSEAFLASCRAARLKAVRRTGERRAQSEEQSGGNWDRSEWKEDFPRRLVSLLAGRTDGPQKKVDDTALWEALEIMEAITYGAEGQSHEDPPAALQQALLQVSYELFCRYEASECPTELFWKFAAQSAALLGPKIHDKGLWNLILEAWQSRVHQAAELDTYPHSTEGCFEFLLHLVLSGSDDLQLRVAETAAEIRWGKCRSLLSGMSENEIVSLICLWSVWGSQILAHGQLRQREKFWESSEEILPELVRRLRTSSSDYLLALLRLMRLLAPEHSIDPKGIVAPGILRDLQPWVLDSQESEAILLFWELQVMSGHFVGEPDFQKELWKLSQGDQETPEEILKPIRKRFGQQPTEFFRTAGLSTTLQILNLLSNSTLSFPELTFWFGFLAASLSSADIVELPSRPPLPSLRQLQENLRPFKKASSPVLAANTKRLLSFLDILTNK